MLRYVNTMKILITATITTIRTTRTKPSQSLTIVLCVITIMASFTSVAAKSIFTPTSKNSLGLSTSSPSSSSSSSLCLPTTRSLFNMKKRESIVPLSIINNSIERNVFDRTKRSMDINVVLSLRAGDGFDHWEEGESEYYQDNLNDNENNTSKHERKEISNHEDDNNDNVNHNEPNIITFDDDQILEEKAGKNANANNGDDHFDALIVEDGSNEDEKTDNTIFASIPSNDVEKEDFSESLLPDDYYTIIFGSGTKNKQNSLYGGGKFLTSRERIKNRLRKWKSDDMKAYIASDIDDDYADENDRATSFNSKELEELNVLHQLIYKRAREYIDEILEYEKKALEKRKIGTVPHPKKFLHYITPKIPAIKRSPEIMLRISSARAGVDVRAAACIVGVMGIITEYYMCVVESLESKIGQDNEDNSRSTNLSTCTVYKSIVTDRRFEQLIECIQCGVDVEEIISQFDNKCTEKMLSDVMEENKKKGRSDSPNDSSRLNDLVELKEGINVVDAARTIWGLSVFISNHDIKRLGEKECSQLIRALQLRSNHLLRNQLYDLRKGRSKRISSDTCEKFIDEIHSLLRDTISVMWASDCAIEAFRNEDGLLMETCTFILRQDVQEIWDARQKKESKEANVDDIVERLAEAEEVDSINDNIDCQNEYQSPEERLSSESELMAPDTEMSRGLLSTPQPKTRFLLDHLSPTDLLVSLKAICKEKNIDHNHRHNILSKIFNKIAFWMDHDLNILNGHHEQPTKDATYSDQVELVDAASLLSVSKEIGTENQELSVSTHDNGIKEKIDRSKLLMSINDLGVIVWIIGWLNKDSVTFPAEKCFQLLLEHFRSHKIENLERIYLLHILWGSSIHAKSLLKSSSSIEMAINFFSEITSLVIDEFGVNSKEGVIRKTTTSTELTTLVSSLSLISSGLKFAGNANVIDEQLNQNLSSYAMSQAIESNEDFRLEQLCKIARIYTESYQSPNVNQDIEITSYKVLGKMVAKISKALENLSFNDEELGIYSSRLPVMFFDLCKLFSCLVELNLFPYEWCRVISKGFKQPDLAMNLTNEDLIQFLYASVRVRIIASSDGDCHSSHASSLVYSILKDHKKALCRSSTSLSPHHFAMLVWSLALHNSDIPNEFVENPNFTLAQLKRLSASLSVKMLIGLTFASETVQSRLLMNLLSDIQVKVPMLNTGETCSVVECLYELKRSLNADRLLHDLDGKEALDDDLDEVSEEIDAISPHKYRQSIENLFSTIAGQLKSRHSEFSMKEMKNLLQFYEQPHFIFDLIEEKADEMMHKIENQDRAEESISDAGCRTKEGDITDKSGLLPPFEMDSKLENEEQEKDKTLQEMENIKPHLILTEGEIPLVSISPTLKEKQSAYEFGWIQQHVIKEDPQATYRVMMRPSCFQLFP